MKSFTWYILLKDVPALYVVKWIYVGRSRVHVSCLCTLAHQLFAAQVAAMYKLPAFNVPLGSAVHDLVHTNRRLHLQTALVYFGWLRQTANKKRQTLHHYENCLSLSTENFRCKLSSVTWPTFESLLSKMYFRKKTFHCVMTLRLFSRWLCGKWRGDTGCGYVELICCLEMTISLWFYSSFADSALRLYFGIIFVLIYFVRYSIVWSKQPVTVVSGSFFQHG